MTWFIFALMAPAFFSASNFVDRFLVEKRIKNPAILTILDAFFILAVGLLVLAAIGFPIFSLSQTVLIILAGMLIGIGLFPYYAAIAIDDPSRVVTYFQTIPVFVLALSYIFLHEALLPNELLGFAAVVLGAFILSIKKFDRHFFKLRRSFWYMMIASLCIAVSIVIFRFVVVKQGFWSSLGYDFIGEGLGGLTLLFSARYRRGSIKAFQKVTANLFAIFSANQGIYMLGRFFSYQAVAMAPVALVSAVGGLQPLYTLVFGIILSIFFPSIIKEDIRRKTIAIKAAAMALMLFGLWFMYR